MVWSHREWKRWNRARCHLKHIKKGTFQAEATVWTSQGLMGLSPTVGSPTEGPVLERWTPQNDWLWRQAGLTFRRPRGLWEVETPLLKGIQNIPHPLGPRVEIVVWKEPGSELLPHLGEPPVEAGGNWSSTWDHNTGRSHLGSSLYHVDTDPGKRLFGILPLAY